MERITVYNMRYTHFTIFMIKVQAWFQNCFKRGMKIEKRGHGVKNISYFSVCLFLKFFYSVFASILYIFLFFKFKGGKQPQSPQFYWMSPVFHKLYVNNHIASSLQTITSLGILTGVCTDVRNIYYPFILSK